MRSLFSYSLRKSTPQIILFFFALASFIIIGTSAFAAPSTKPSLSKTPHKTIPKSQNKTTIQPPAKKAATPLSKSVKKRPAKPKIELEVTIGHSNQIVYQIFSPDSKILATNSTDGTIKLWDVATGTLKSTLPTPTTSSQMAFSPDGARLAVLGNKGKLMLWNTADGVLLFQRNEDGPNTGYRILDFSRDGQRLAGSNGYGIYIWNAANGKLEGKLANADLKISVCAALGFSADGAHLFVADREGPIRDILWRESKIFRTINEPSINYFQTFVLSPNRRKAARVSAYYDEGSFAIFEAWNLATGAKEWNWAIMGSARNVRFSPEADTISYSDGSITHHYNFQTRAHSEEKELPNFRMVSPDKRTAVVQGNYFDLILKDAETEANPRTLKAGSSIAHAAFSPDGKRLACANSNSGICLWNLASGEMISAPGEKTFGLRKLVFTPDGSTLIAAQYNGLTLLNAQTGALIRKIPLTLQSDVIAFSHDGSTLALDASSDGRIEIWDVPSGTKKQTLAGHQISVSELFFSPDSSLLFSMDRGSIFKIWDLKRGYEKTSIASLDYLLRGALSPNGRVMLTNLHFTDEAQPRLIFWNTQTGALEKSASGIPFSALRMEFFPDDKTLALPSNDPPSIRFWDIATNRLGNTIELGNSGNVIFSRAAGLFAEFGSDAAVRLRNAAGETRLTLYLLPDAQWLSVTPQNYFASSPKAAPFMRWRENGVLAPDQNKWQTFFNRDKTSPALPATKILTAQKSH